MYPPPPRPHQRQPKCPPLTRSPLTCHTCAVAAPHPLSGRSPNQGISPAAAPAGPSRPSEPATLERTPARVHWHRSGVVGLVFPTNHGEICHRIPTDDASVNARSHGIRVRIETNPGQAPPVSLIFRSGQGRWGCALCGRRLRGNTRMEFLRSSFGWRFGRWRLCGRGDVGGRRWPRVSFDARR